MPKTDRDAAVQKPVRQRITIIGAGCIGASIGLALRGSKDGDHLEIVGHDRDTGQARLAQQMGAFTTAAINLDLALDDAQLVILAVPFSELREALGRRGAASGPCRECRGDGYDAAQEPAIAWARAALPANAHYVGGDPYLAPGVSGWEPLHGVANARPDLFHGPSMLLPPGPRSIPVQCGRLPIWPWCWAQHHSL